MPHPYMFLTNSRKYLCTFQLYIDAAKITNFWSQQHNLLLHNSNNYINRYKFWELSQEVWYVACH